MTYREWKTMAQGCVNRTDDSSRPHKGSSRGRGAAVCGITGKRCEMGKCPKRA